MNVFGIAIALAGVILFLAALLATVRANRDAPIPYWTRPVSEPRGSVAMRALGAALTIFGAALIAQSAGWWALIVVLAGPAVAIVAIVAHNTRIRSLSR
ncbi:hypothetical protein ACYX8G_12670 [Microbacterium saperdae]